MGDISITINGIKNKLTCKEWKYFNENYTFDYMVSNKAPFNYIDLTFTKGHYKIKNIEMYAILLLIKSVNKTIKASIKPARDIILPSLR